MSPTGADGETTKTVLASVSATTRNRTNLPYASQEGKGKPLVRPEGRSSARYARRGATSVSRLTKMSVSDRLTDGGLKVSHWIVEGVTLAQSLLASPSAFECQFLRCAATTRLENAQ